MSEVTREDTQNAKKALCDIISYVEADTKYKEYAQLITYIEWAIKKGKDNE